MELAVKVTGMGCKGLLHVFIDGYKTDDDEAVKPEQDAGDNVSTEEAVEYSSVTGGKPGTEIGVVEIGLGDGIYRGRVQNVTGRHAVYFKADINLPKGVWTTNFFDGRVICELEEFVFMK